MTDFKELEGKILTEIENLGDELIFHTKDKKYSMHHSQDCCESVSIEEIHGDLDDLLNNPILRAEESTADERETHEIIKDKLLGIERYEDGSNLWTFYKLSTIKGSVTIRWYGTSNGYYSVSVDFKEL